MRIRFFIIMGKMNNVKVVLRVQIPLFPEVKKMTNLYDLKDEIYGADKSNYPYYELMVKLAIAEKIEELTEEIRKLKDYNGNIPVVVHK